MKLGVFTPILGHMPFNESVSLLAQQGVQAVEIGCGGYPGKAHCDPAVLLNDPQALAQFRNTLKSNHMEIAALSAHGNVVHPDPEIAAQFQRDFTNAILLAEKLGVRRIVGFSGCPGGCAADRTPNWVVASWPEDFGAILDYQWNEVLIPYWKKTAAFAQEHGIEKIALEMHPGFCVYNPKTLLRLREAIGPIIGANLDPSHLFWQQIDPVCAIRNLGGAIHFFHAKDTYIDASACNINGVLETDNSLAQRSWFFRTVGYGHDKLQWNNIISALKQAGYDDVLSIEHEDPLMTPMEGLTKAISFMKDVLIFE